MSKQVIRANLEPLIIDWAKRALWDDLTFWDELTLWQGVLAEGVAIAWEAVDFTPPADQIWLQATLIPADTVSGSLCTTEYKGVLRINVFTPSGKGPGLAEEAATSLARVFRVGLNTNGVRVMRPPSVGQVAIDPNGYCMVPLSIRYQLNS